MRRSTNARRSTNRSSAKKISIILNKKPDAEGPQLFNSYKIQQIQQLRQIFKMYDRDNTGDISSRTLKFLLRGLGDNVNQQQVDIVLKNMDDDHSGTIDFQQFLLYMLQKVNAQCLQDDIIDIFKILDKDGTGYITANDLHILTQDKNCEELVQQFCQRADIQCQGQIQYTNYINRILKEQ